MKQMRAGEFARKLTPIVAVMALTATGCDSPMHPYRAVRPETALLQSQAAATMQRVARLADSRAERLRGAAREELQRKLTVALNRVSASDRHYKLAFFSAESFDAFDREMAALRTYAGKHYPVIMRKLQREHADVIKQLLVVEPSWETTFDCLVGIGLDLTASCEDGEGIPSDLEGDAEAPYCLKEAAAYTGAYILTLAAVRAYTAKPSEQTRNAVLFATAGWFYAADVLAACIARHLEN